MPPPEHHAAYKRRPHYKRWLLLLIVAAFLIWLIISITTPPATPNAVSISFLGYTNFIIRDRPFAMLLVSNRADYTVRWYNMGIEYEDYPEFLLCPILDSKNPGYTYTHSGGKIVNTNDLPIGSTLRPGESLALFIGQPNRKANESLARWRFSMFFSRYGLALRYYDFAIKHNAPPRLGPILLVDSLKLLNPSNNVTSSSTWLSK